MLTAILIGAVIAASSVCGQILAKKPEYNEHLKAGICLAGVFFGGHIGALITPEGFIAGLLGGFAAFLWGAFFNGSLESLKGTLRL